MTGSEYSTGLPQELAERDFEQVVLCRDPSVGLESVIAVHDTSRGPALGGVRMRSYPSRKAAIADALNLAQAMTFKSALAGLPLGGGKSVINVDPAVPNRREILVAHARYIATLGGRYIPGVDMGTTVEDLDLIGHYAPVVVSRRGDPSYYTARGVVRSMQAALSEAGFDGFGGRRVAIQGLGNVGFHVARMLTDYGAEVLAADIDPERVVRAADELGARPVELAEVLVTDVDVVCPCAGGGVIDDAIAAQLKAKVLVGAANNVLAHSGIAVGLAARGIVHVPDFLANAGGIIATEAELRDDESGLAERVDAIADTAATVLTRAHSAGADTVSVALELARERVAEHRMQRPYFPQLATASV
ncbi:Glu/Leu/Phe/Val family dehydrogenase [Rhodococcus koreensis]